MIARTSHIEKHQQRVRIKHYCCAELHFCRAMKCCTPCVCLSVSSYMIFSK